jgi:hypothetical protein
MNKRLLVWSSSGVVAAILVFFSVINLTPLGQSHAVLDTIGITLLLLALPMRLYVIFVLGEDGHWSLPVFFLFLALSGLMWGVIVERIHRVIARRKPVV